MIKINEQDYEKLKAYLVDLIQVIKDEGASNYMSDAQDKIVFMTELEEFAKRLY